MKQVKYVMFTLTIIFIVLGVLSFFILKNRIIGVSFLVTAFSISIFNLILLKKKKSSQ